MVKDEKVEDVNQGPSFDTTVDSIRDYWFEQFPNESATLQSAELGSTVVKEEKLDQGPNLDASVNASIDQLGINASVKSETVNSENVEIGTSSFLPTVGDASKNDVFTSVVEDEMINDGGNAEIERNSVLGIVDSLITNEVNAVTSEKMDHKENESESESESSNSSSSSSSSYSSSTEGEDDSSSEDEDDSSSDDDEKKKDKMEIKQLGEMEEGEIREDGEKKTIGKSSDVEEMFSWSDAEDDGDEDSSKGVRSKNELKILPPVPPVQVTLNPEHKLLSIGVVLSVLGTQVIVEGVENHTPLNEGSILWISETRSPLGIVDDIFGPVKNPYYMVRYNSEAEVPAGVSQGILISFVPEFASFVLNEKSLYKKGYDASGDNDEELSEELEFSDDEKEAEYKRQQKMAKRGGGDMNNQNQKKNNKKKGKDREMKWNDYNHNNMQQMPVNLHRSGGVSSSTVQYGGGFMGGNGTPHAFPSPRPNIGGSVLPNPNGNWMNNGQMRPQQQINRFPNEMPMPWPPQQSVANQFQLQPLLNQILANMIFPNMVQSNAPGAPNFGSWSGPMVQNSSNNMTAGISELSLGNNSNNPPFGNGRQGFETNALQNPESGFQFGRNEAPSQFIRGAPFGRGGGRAPRRGGGRFIGGRGRRQFN